MFGRGKGGEGKRRVLRKDRSGANPVLVGGLLLIVVSAAVFLGFTKHIPFTSGFKVEAVFRSANSIRKNSPVRIAGVNIGKVKDVKRQPGTNAAIVVMEIDKKGLPIHKDATMKIRPRIFLEGNFFVDLRPGTPSAPTISDGDTIPMTQTATPVQLDQVLTALQQDTRDDLRKTLEGYGTALTAKPTAAEDASADPAARGETAAKSLNDSFKTGGDALKNTSIVNQALLGTQQHDVSGLIRNLGTVSRSLDRNESQLQDLVTNFNTTMASFASRKEDLRSTIRELAPTLETANRTFDSLNAAFPNTRAFAREILPGVRESAPTISASFPFIKQARALLSPQELQGLVNDLRPTTANLSKVVDVTTKLLPQADLIAQCATKVILPTGDIKIQDGPLSTGVENYKEFWYAMAGIAGEGQNFDGNGPYTRFQPGGGTQTFSTGKLAGSGDQVFGKTSQKPLGTRPAYTGRRPPHVSDVPCKNQAVPDLSDAKTGPADGQAPGGSSSVAPTPATPTTPALPPVPPLPLARKAVRQAGASSPADTGSLTSQIVSRLNPFRTGDKQVSKP